MFRWISILALPAEGVYTHLLFGTSLLGVASLLRVALEAQYVQYLSNTGVLLAHSQLVIHDGLSATNPLGRGDAASVQDLLRRASSVLAAITQFSGCRSRTWLIFRISQNSCFPSYRILNRRRSHHCQLRECVPSTTSEIDQRFRSELG